MGEVRIEKIQQITQLICLYIKKKEDRFKTSEKLAF
jgi:hypothetical protein